MGEHPRDIQQGVGPSIGVSQGFPVTAGWKLMLLYVAMTVAGVLLIVF